MSTFIKGEVILLNIYDGVDSYDPVACLTSNSLSETRNIIESQTKCDPGKIAKTQGSYSYEISLEGEAIVSEASKYSYAELRTLLTGTDLVEWSMGPVDGTNTLYGSGYFSELSLDAPAGDEIATFSASLMGDATDIVTVNPNP